MTVKGLLKTVKGFSDDIGMEFGLDKCAKATFIHGKLTKSSAISLDIDTHIRNLDPEDTYKYLGVNEGNGTKHAAMKEKIRKECYRRVRAVLKTELNSQNRIIAINTLGIPAITYSFNNINWQVQEIKRIDKNKGNCLPPIACIIQKQIWIDSLPRSNGGRGLIQLELTLKTSTIGLNAFLLDTKDWMLKLVLKHENTKNKYSISEDSKKYCQNITLHNSDENEPSKLAKHIRNNAKGEGLKQLQHTWQQKPLHGDPTRTNQTDEDTQKNPSVVTQLWSQSRNRRGYNSCSR